LTSLASAPDWLALESILSRDPGGRGVASYRWHDRLLASGKLEAAARSLADSGKHVAIITGFCVAGGGPPAAETDGPPGALYLARTLTALGIDVTLTTASGN
jgi:D-glutamate cyclase